MMENFDRVNGVYFVLDQGECDLEPGFKGRGPEVATTLYCRS
jgi:hypothetical protein